MTPRSSRSDPDRPRRRWLRVLAGLALLAGAFWVLVGPWPAYEDSYEGKAWANETFARIESVTDATAFDEPGRLRVGWAKVEITPPVGEPLAGYSARSPMTSTRVEDRLFARAITVSNGDRTLTLLGAEILLALPDLRAKVLGKTGLAASEIYFTATHTHSGPGGYDAHPIAQISLGTHEPAILDRLAGALAETVLASRRDLQPARMRAGMLSGDRSDIAPGVVNRLTGLPGRDRMVAMSFWLDGDASGPVAVFLTHNAHATCDEYRDRTVGGDYPGWVARRLETGSTAVALVAAGPVGTCKPEESLPRGDARVARMGGHVLACLRATGVLEPGPAGPSQQVVLAADLVPVDLPAHQIRLGDRWRLSPVISSALHERRTHVQAMRIGPVLLVGMPGDFSDELLVPLDNFARSSKLLAEVTSFNGDYVGYLTRADRYALKAYETRDMSFFGPSCGEYLAEVGTRLAGRLAERENPPSQAAETNSP